MSPNRGAIHCLLAHFCSLVQPTAFLTLQWYNIGKSNKPCMIFKGTGLLPITELFKGRQGLCRKPGRPQAFPCGSRGVGQPKEKMFSHSAESSGCTECVWPKYFHQIAIFFPVKITLREMLCFFHFMPCNQIVQDLHTQGLFQSLTI